MDVSASLHVALQLNWILVAALEDYHAELPDGSRNKKSNPVYFNRCAKLLQVETALRTPLYAKHCSCSCCSTGTSRPCSCRTQDSGSSNVGGDMPHYYPSNKLGLVPAAEGECFQRR